jgi:hypothetical protein
MRHLRHPVSSRVASLLSCAAFCLCTWLWPGRPALAYCVDDGVQASNDLALECLIDPTDSNPRPYPNSAVPTSAEESRFRGLISELGGVLALPMVEPADTVGFNGFHFSFDTHITSINRDADYWSGRVTRPIMVNGQTIQQSFSTAGVRKVTAGMLPVVSLMMRKGVWMPIPPLPSVELGFGVSHLVNSSMFALNGYLKLAIHEGYHDVWVPSIAFRAGVTRLAGSPQLDMTIITADGVISKAFGAGGTFTLEPYLGAGAFFTIARSQVIDTAPTTDLYRGPIGAGMDFNDPNKRSEALAQKIIFPTQSDIIRARLFVGLQLHYAILAITAGYTIIFSGFDSNFDISTPGTFTPKDISGYQHQINLSAGLRF